MKILKVFDNEGTTYDRYTIVFDEKEHKGMNLCLGLSDNPRHPFGFCQWCSCMTGDHLGKEIKFEELPIDVQECVKERMAEE